LNKNNMKLLLPIFLLFTLSLPAQDLQWEMNLGTSKEGIIADVIQTIDGQVAVIGNEADGTCYFELLQMENGKRVFSQPLVFEEKGSLTAMTQAYDGTFILVGTRVVEGQKKSDGWWLKVDNTGRILENKTFGEADEDGFNDVITAADGDVVMVGYQTVEGIRKAWWVKTNTDGALPRMATYESNESERDEARAVVQNANGRFVMTGITEPNKGNDANVWIMDVDGYGERTVADLYKLFDETAIVGKEKKQKALKLWEEGTDIITTQNGGFAISGFQGPGSMRNNWLAVLDKGKEDKPAEIIFNAAIGVGKFEGKEEGHTLTQLFDGRIVIGGQTEAYQSGTGNSARMFLQVINAETYQVEDTIYFNRIKNKNAKLTKLASTYDGNLLMAGQKYQDKKGAWLGLYALEQNGVFASNSTIKKNRLDNIQTDNQNMVLEANERGYALLNLQNTGGQNLFGLQIKVTGNLPKGVTIPKTIFVNEFLKNSAKKIAIPIEANDEVGIEVVNLKLVIENAKGKVLKTIPWTFYVGEAPVPHLEVMNYEFKTEGDKIIKGSAFDLVLEVKNTGRAIAMSPMIDLRLPEGVTIVTDWKIPKQQLDINEMMTVTIPLSVIESYEGSLIAIKSEIRAKNQTKNTQRQFTVTVNEPPVVEDFFVDIHWLQPSIGFSNNDIYNTPNGKFAISLQFFSNIDIDEDKIELYINDDLIKGARLGEVSLRRSKVDGGNQRITYQYERQIILTKSGGNKIYFKYKEERLTRTSASEPLLIKFEEKRPILYILAIGPDYKNNNSYSTLTYTQNDAKAFVNAFEKQMGDNRFFETIIITKLLGADATSHNIKLKVVEMANNAKASKGKAMMLTYISSHGTLDDKGEFIVVADDYNPANEVTFVRYQEDIIDKLATVKGSNRLIFIDACKSGGAVSGSKGLDAAVLSDAFIAEKLDELIQASGFITFASCKSKEQSWEDAQWRNGAFTEAMLEAFENKTVEVNSDGTKAKADVSNDKILTIGEFIDFVQLRVPYMVQKTKSQKQNPIISEKEGLDMSMPFFILD
jgi:hypothetical protein